MRLNWGSVLHPISVMREFCAPITLLYSFLFHPKQPTTIDFTIVSLSGFLPHQRRIQISNDEKQTPIQDTQKMKGTNPPFHHNNDNNDNNNNNKATKISQIPNANDSRIFVLERKKSRTKSTPKPPLSSQPTNHSQQHHGTKEMAMETHSQSC